MRKEYSRVNMMRKFTKKYFILILLLLVFSIPAGLNYSGFCMSKGRWLSDEEKIKLAISYIINLNTIPIETETHGTQYYQQVKYGNVEEFLENHPGCCKINPGGPYDLPPPTLLDKVFGKNSSDVVEINYIARYIDEKKQRRSQLIKSQAFQTNCGQSYE